MGEEKKVMELCALPKEFIKSLLDKLVADNKDIINIYENLIAALNTPVQMVPSEDIKHTVTQEDVDMNPGENLVVGEEITIPKEAIIN